MSDFAYTPRTDGTLFSTEITALPGRDPSNGQFVSTQEANDDEELDHPMPYGMHLLGEQDRFAAEHFYALHDETDEEAWERYCVEQVGDPIGFDAEENEWTDEWDQEYSARVENDWEDLDYWRDYLGLSWGASREAIVAAWIEYKFQELIDDDQGVDDEHEYLPTFEGRRYTLDNYYKTDDRDYRYYVNGHGDRTQKGKPSRFNKRNRVCTNHIRAARFDTHRQIDHLWMVEMTDGYGDYGRMSTHAWLTDMAEVDKHDVEWHLEDVNSAIKAENAKRYTELDAAHERGEFDEELTLFIGHDTGLGDVLTFESMEDYDRFVDMLDAMDEDDMLPDEEDFYDRYMWGILTEEEIEMLDAEARARDEAEEALELEFEHVPASNAMGTKARLAAAAARL